MKKKQMCVDFQSKLSGVTNMRQEFMVCQIKSHFSIVCRFSLFSLKTFIPSQWLIGDCQNITYDAKYFFIMSRTPKLLFVISHLMIPISKMSHAIDMIFSEYHT